jgi:hypothetical protein
MTDKSSGFKADRAWADWPAGAPIVCSLTDPCAICRPAVEAWRAKGGQPDPRPCPACNGTGVVPAVAFA